MKSVEVEGKRPKGRLKTKMSTIDDRDIVNHLIEHNGHYEDDPQVIQIHKYKNNWGGVSYHLSYNLNHVVNLMNSPYCHNIELLWRKK